MYLVLVADSWNDLESMLFSPEKHCDEMGAAINTRKTKCVAVLPSSSCPQPKPMHLHPGGDPVDVDSLTSVIVRRL